MSELEVKPEPVQPAPSPEPVKHYTMDAEPLTICADLPSL